MAGPTDGNSFWRIDLEELRVALRILTAVFLGLPLVIFAVGWLRPAVAAVATAAVVAALAGIAGVGPYRPRAHGTQPVFVAPAALLAGLMPAVLLALVSGAGGRGLQNWDWLKHEAILRDLVAQPWPVRYLTDTGPAALVYYLAYYLPAAAIGKVAGWASANVAISMTSMTGAVLGVLWLVVLVRGAPILCGWLLALFSGMDVLGAILVAHWPPDLGRIFADYQLGWWMPHWQYSSVPSMIDFAPHQAVAGWLLAALLADALQSGRERFPMVALGAVGALWSPLVVAGLIPLAAAFLVARRNGHRVALREQGTAANLGGAALATVLAAYFASRVLPVALPESLQPTHLAVARGGFWLLPARLPLGDFLFGYTVFVTCEFLVLWALVWREQRALRAERATAPLFAAAGATLMVLPFVHYGRYNDLVMRASIPALFIVVVATAQVLRGGVRNARTLLIATVLAIGALYSGNLMRMHVRSALLTRMASAVPPEGAVRSLFQIQLTDKAANRTDFLTQYLGSEDSFFFRKLARRSPALRVTIPDGASRKR